MSHQLTVIQFPSKKWGFVGSVPCSLLYARKDGKPITNDDISSLHQAGPGFVPHVETMTWESEEAALAEAIKQGFSKK